MKINRAALLALVAASALTAAGCSGAAAPQGTTTPNSVPNGTQQVAAEHNPTDITFAQGMIPHHQQAIDMAELASERGASAQVKELAAKIEQAQGPEIEQLKQMLEAWGAPEPSESEGMSGMGHGGGGNQSAMPNMMTEQQMQQLQQANGPAFDKMFLEMMIMHHQGAIQMAQTESAGGQNAQAKTLAQKIIEDQRAEISTMEAMLKAS